MNKSFANRLREALRLRNMKQIELSKKTGMTRSLISCYLSGRYEAKQDRLYKLANALDINPAWLMGYDVPMESSKIQFAEFPAEKVDFVAEKANFVGETYEPIKELTADELYQEVQKLVSNSTLSDKDKDKIMSDIGYICEKD